MKSEKRAKPAGGPSAQPDDQPPQGKKRKKTGNPYWEPIVSAMKNKDAIAAWESFSKGKKEANYNPGQLKAIATLFLGMEDWGFHVLPLAVNKPADDAVPVYLDWASQVLDEIQSSETSADEQLICLKARLCALQRQPEAALQAAQDCGSRAVKLRTYIPALAAFAGEGDATGAMRTFKHICGHGADVGDLAESEYIYLLHVLCACGTYEDLATVLRHVGSRLGALQDESVQVLQAGFEKGTESADGKKQSWDISPVSVDPKGNGFVEVAQDSLQELSMEPGDWEQFAKSVHELAQSRERKAGSFDKFVQVMHKQDHTIFMDAANIAFFNTMKFMTDDTKDTEERFQWPQVQQLHKVAQKTFPDRRIMVIAHNYRCRDKFVRTQESRGFLERLRNAGNLWVTPNGSNDDWYWLYGVISKGKRGMLISNDDMRDHIFELLRPRYFYKWREHHRCKYDVSTEKGGIVAALNMPPKYSTCVQLLPQAGAWMIPRKDGSWLCAKRQAS